jgi:ABC-type xylose transport system permease subunit
VVVRPDRHRTAHRGQRADGLTAITAVLLGGTGLNGRTGTVLAAVLSVLVLSTLDNGLLLGIPAF